LLQGAEIRGVVTVKRTLTKRTATPSVDSYARGATVLPPATENEDPIAYERTHTVIFLEGPSLPAGRPVTKTMEQENRTFTPDLLVVPVGSTVSFPNLDPTFHNVFSLSKAKAFDLGNYSKGRTRMVNFDKPGIVLVNCRIHTNMSAVVMVTPNQFYAVADAEGRFSIKDVPPGKYTVVAWHKAAGFLRKEIVAVDGAPANVDFFVPLGANGEPRLARARE
jgi:plastocyanin